LIPGQVVGHLLLGQVGVVSSSGDSAEVNGFVFIACPLQCLANQLKVAHSLLGRDGWIFGSMWHQIE